MKTMKFYVVETGKTHIILYVAALLQSTFVSLSIFRKKMRLVSIFLCSALLLFIKGKELGDEVYYAFAFFLYSLSGVLIAKQKTHISFYIIFVEFTIHLLITFNYGVKYSAYFCALMVAAYVTKWKQTNLTFTFATFSSIIAALAYHNCVFYAEITVLFAIVICNTMLFFHL